MVLLDTNVISEMRRRDKMDARVLEWSESVAIDDQYLSVISVLELEAGALSIARRDPEQGAVFRRWIDTRILPGFAGRILPVDLAIAMRCAALHVPNPRPDRDALIAATALVHNMPVATRNVADFKPMGVTVVNPWN